MRSTSYTLLLLVAIACRQDVARGPTIELALDDTSRTVTIDRAMSLSSLVSAAPARWIEVRADAADGRWLELPTPTTTYPDGELRLYSDRGRAALGVFANDRPLVALSPITKVRVSTKTAPAPSITIVVRGHTQPWTATARETQVRDVIGETGTARVIGDGEIVVAPGDNAVLKLNQQGEYVVRVWDNDREHPTREVRRVTQIIVE